MASKKFKRSKRPPRNKKQSKNSKKIIKKIKEAIAIPTKSRQKDREKRAKPARNKTKLHTKKEVIVKEKPAERKIEPVVPSLTKEDMRRLAEILSRPFIRETLVDIGGENAIAIIRNFERAASDEDISKKLKIKISDVRAALNKLHNEGLVLYNRYKDNETGWYSYSWYLNKEKMEKWAKEQIKKFESRGHGDGGEFYVCPFCGFSTIVGFEVAIEKGFKCEICNRQLEFLDEEKMQRLGIFEQRNLTETKK
ncbi:MAG: hypothetical protein QXT45_06025 [Candidatus Bilamarchaeaceae archaeon]